MYGKQLANMLPAQQPQPPSTQAPPTVDPAGNPIYKTHPFFGPPLGKDKTHFKKTTI